MIPESQHTKPLCFQPGTALSIRGGLAAMLSTVQLNDESYLKADEVDDVWSYRLLPAKFMSVELAQTEMAP
jgi:hypothetical protein